jgi:ABC-2 type transport system permease protein
MRAARLLAQWTRVNVMMTMEYRTGFFIYMANLVIQPAISLLVWLAVGDAAGDQLPVERTQLVTYYVLMGLVAMLTGVWTAEYLADDIRTGALSQVLMRPAPAMLEQIGNNLGEKVVKAGLLLPLLVALGWVFRESLALPTSPARWALFGAAVALAAALSFLMNYVLGSLAFWLQDVSGLLALEDLLDKLLAGRFIPLVFLPSALGPLLVAQPWRYTLSFPLEVLTGQLDAAGVAQGFAWQIGWLLAVWLAYRLVWRYGLRTYAAAGGGQ